MANPSILPDTHVYDPTGTLSENYVENEQRVLPDRDKRAVVTRFGAFFTEGFVMRDANGNTVNPSKYQYCLFSEELSRKIGKEVVGGVIINDPTVLSPVYVDYHCVGGPWGATNEVIAELFYQLQADDRPVHWPNVLGKPDGYRPAHHYQDIGDLYGAENWVAAIERATNAMLMGDSASHDEIFRYIDSVKVALQGEISTLNTTLRAYVDQQVNAFNASIQAVDDRVTAVRTELLAADSVINNRITTVQGTLQGNIDSVNNALALHTGNKNNPHETTAAQLNVYTQAQVNALITSVNSSLTNYVKKSTAESMSLDVSNGQLLAYVSGAWKIVWPPQWQ